ncbi:MAG: polyprenyl diphosphate synthase [Alphaproteobacteria bacterium]
MIKRLFAKKTAESTPEGSSEGPAPRHIAIIMDGNRRWARARGLPVIEGHRQGLDALKRTVTALKKHDVTCLTVYAFSSDNWKRSADEISGLMKVLRYALKREVAELHKNGIRLKIMGDRSRFPTDIIDGLDAAEELTKDNAAFTLTLCVNYGAREDITSAVKNIASAVQSGDINPDDITEELISKTLSSNDLPEVDLLIRTSGEERVSNFLLWEISYTEMMFVKDNWPDFGQTHVDAAIENFKSRNRRFGAGSVT